MATTLYGTMRDARESSVPGVPVNLLAGSLRRTTCDVCRERKVRCDRTKPECLRCRRFGSVCTYPSPDADAARIHKTLHDLSKRLEDAESRLQSHQPSPLSASEGQIQDFNAIEWPSLRFSPDAGENAEFSAWRWDQPMVESLLPDGMLFNGILTPIESVNTSAPATASQAYSLPREPGHEPVNDVVAIEPPSPAESCLGLCPISSDTCAALFEAYFNIVQRHLPLVNREVFFRTLEQSPEKHQTLALKYAICMAGSQAESVASQMKEQYYIAARHHLEQTELGSGRSSFWTVEATQALILVARFEFEHFANPRAMITMSRLSALMSVLDHYEHSGSEIEQSLDEDELNLRRMISLISLSIKFQETCVTRSTCSKTFPGPSISDDIESERLKIDLLANSWPIPENEPFGVLCISLRIAVDAKHHDRMAAAVVAGVDLPSFNFCRDHERIETRIGNLLFKTASCHGQKSKFLGTIAYECREESVASAIDMNDLLCLAEVRRADKIAIYREAGFYLMPALRLAAEALLPALQARDQDSTRGVSRRHHEIRNSLKTIVQVMDACKNAAATYDDCIAKFRSCLEDSEEQPTPLRTSFSASSSLGQVGGNIRCPPTKAY
ncbi:hypothetical protein CHU98_g10180 [Xylaria longipes]|nr:hypothetical protein CHU98_g10180 [Xylaria longipes]